MEWRWFADIVGISFIFVSSISRWPYYWLPPTDATEWGIWHLPCSRRTRKQLPQPQRRRLPTTSMSVMTIMSVMKFLSSAHKRCLRKDWSGFPTARHIIRWRAIPTGWTGHWPPHILTVSMPEKTIPSQKFYHFLWLLFLFLKKKIYFWRHNGFWETYQRYFQKTISEMQKVLYGICHYNIN